MADTTWSYATYTMTTESPKQYLENARLAYTIIQSLLDSHEALSDLLVVMSHALDEDVLKALTATNEWQSYLESKRNLETTRAQVEKLTDELRRL